MPTTRFAFALLVIAPLAARAQALKSEDDKTLYAIGYRVGQNVQFLQLKPNELKIVEQGFRDAATSAKAKVDPAERQDAMQTMARTRSEASMKQKDAAAEKTAAPEKEKGRAYAANAEKEPGAQKLSDGIVLKVTKPATGAMPKATDRVKVNYEGKLVDGTVFDSSYKRGQPAEFPLNGVIKCWTEGLQKMHVGEEATVVCPSETAYGNVGHPPTIPGGSTLVFKVELLSIEGGAAAGK
jgi:FKBP-type peptidyl-prolyl cis-trans isomerase FkpA